MAERRKTCKKGRGEKGKRGRKREIRREINGVLARTRNLRRPG
jgi:hypothetical protein